MDPAPETASARTGRVDAPDSASLRDYMMVLYKRKIWLVGALAVVVGLTALWTFRQTKIYVATATVVIDQTPPQVLGRSVDQVVELGSGDYWSSQEYLTTQVQLVRSQSLSASVVRELGLHRDKKFVGPRPTTVEAAARILMGKITAEMSKSSRVMRIGVADPDPVTAQVLANAVAEEFIHQNLSRKLSSTVEAVDWLQQQLTSIQSDLQHSELALDRFKRDHNVLSLDLDERQNVLANQITKLTDELTATRTRRMSLAARERTLQGFAGREPLSLPGPPIIESELVSQMKSTYARLREEEGDLATRYGDEHPRRLAVVQRIRATREDIDREVRNLLEGQRAELRIQVQTEGLLVTELERVTQEALQLNSMEREYRWLEREQANNEKLYGLVIQRTRETDLTRALQANNIRILDRAPKPLSPSSPRTVLNLLLAAFVGLLGGIGLAVLSEHLDNTIKNQGDVEQRLGLTFLGLVPAIDESERKRRARVGKRIRGPQPHRDLYVKTHPKSQVAECLRSLRTNLSFISPDKPLRSFLVTSSAPQDGKTTIAVSLGIVMAESGQRVVIVDTDMRRPRLHRVFGASTEIGVSNLLVARDGVRIEDTVKATDVPGLSVIPCGPTPPNPAELLQSRRFRELVQELCSRYDRVIFDSPPVVAVTDPAIIGAVVDGTILVARSGQTRIEMGAHGVRQLSDVGANLLGMVLNDVDLGFSGYGYYHYRYGYYYGESQRTSEAVARSSTD